VSISSSADMTSTIPCSKTVIPVGISVRNIEEPHALHQYRINRSFLVPMSVRRHNALRLSAMYCNSNRIVCRDEYCSRSHEWCHCCHRVHNYPTCTTGAATVQPQHRGWSLDVRCDRGGVVDIFSWLTSRARRTPRCKLRICRAEC
jgi:hypothetical protein